ncbi:hypothetical protein RHGRI_020359 [Rhododendron griersonianum]|uniref:F-box domain-containing protein n=1 Tax=Rhododendron griersonianum TaxID=479676 RepID=A0AAV6JL53_9ERIC|nr:hypothetical protein RHGRI_020359 [Rhododendron griersonianum]
MCLLQGQKEMRRKRKKNKGLESQNVGVNDCMMKLLLMLVFLEKNLLLIATNAMNMPQDHLRPLKRAMAIEEAEIISGKFMEKASIEENVAEVAYMDLLPDEILSLIISFLTTRDVVRTSVLATKWRFLSASPLNLDFDWPSIRGMKRGGSRCLMRSDPEDTEEESQSLLTAILNGTGSFEFFGISYNGIRAMIVGLGEVESSDESSGDEVLGIEFGGRAIGLSRMVPDEADNLWLAYNLIAEGDTVQAVTVRNVLREAASGRTRCRSSRTCEAEIGNKS